MKKSVKVIPKERKKTSLPLILWLCANLLLAKLWNEEMFSKLSFYFCFMPLVVYIAALIFLNLVKLLQKLQANFVSTSDSTDYEGERSPVYSSYLTYIIYAKIGVTD